MRLRARRGGPTACVPCHRPLVARVAMSAPRSCPGEHRRLHTPRVEASPRRSAASRGRNLSFGPGRPPADQPRSSDRHMSFGPGHPPTNQPRSSDHRMSYGAACHSGSSGRRRCRPGDERPMARDAGGGAPAARAQPHARSGVRHHPSREGAARSSDEASTAVGRTRRREGPIAVGLPSSADNALAPRPPVNGPKGSSRRAQTAAATEAWCEEAPGRE